MRPAGIVSLLFLLLAACTAPAPRPSPSPSASARSPAATGAESPLPDPLPEIVARLDGEPIYLRDIVPLARGKLNKVPVNTDHYKPRILREALAQYIDRELLLREALAQGVQADTKMVQQIYDAARADFPDEEQWKANLYWRGFDPKGFKAELRAQQTIDVFLARESGAPESTDPRDAAMRRAEAAQTLLERLRAKALIETYL